MKDFLITIKTKSGEEIKMTAVEMAKALGISTELLSLHLEMLPGKED